MKCFHHNDPDGFVSAFWVKKFFEQNEYNISENDFIEMDYGTKDKIDWYNMISENEHVIIVDFSFEPDELRRIYRKTRNVVWIDHHKSAIEKYNDFDIDILGLRVDGIAGCELTWFFYFCPENRRRIMAIPDKNLWKDEIRKVCNKAHWFTKFVGDWDVWKFEFCETEAFITGLDCFGDIGPFSNIWEQLYRTDKCQYIIEKGETCIEYRNSLAKRCLESAFESTIDGYRVLCMNQNDAVCNSKWFLGKIKEYDMICGFSYNGDQWLYSLYADQSKIDQGIDCSAVCAKRGGGGHKGAAGFQSKELIFK
jgi:hypothetical protein